MVFMYCKLTLLSSVHNDVADSTDNIPTIHSLFFSGQNARCINDGNTVQDAVLELRALKTIQKCISKLGQRTERFLPINDESITGYNGFLISTHHCYKPIRRRLRTYPQSREILLQQIADERCFTRGILANEQNHWLGIEVRLIKWR